MYDLDVTCKVIVKDILGEFPRHCDEPNEQIKLPVAQVSSVNKCWTNVNNLSCDFSKHLFSSLSLKSQTF